MNMTLWGEIRRSFTRNTRERRPGKSMSFDYDTNLLTVTDENGNVSYEFQDMQGRTYKQVKYNDSDPIITERYFDGLGNEVITVDPKGSITVKTYNSLNLFARIDLPTERFLGEWPGR